MSDLREKVEALDKLLDRFANATLASGSNVRVREELHAFVLDLLATHEEREGGATVHDRILRLRALLLDVRGALYPAGYRQDGTEFGDGEGGGKAMLARKLVRWIDTGIENDDRYPRRSHTDREPDAWDSHDWPQGLDDRPRPLPCQRCGEMSDSPEAGSPCKEIVR